jgi:hypothetical protein
MVVEMFSHRPSALISPVANEWPREVDYLTATAMAAVPSRSPGSACVIFGDARQQQIQNRIIFLRISRCNLRSAQAAQRTPLRETISNSTSSAAL